MIKKSLETFDVNTKLGYLNIIREISKAKETMNSIDVIDLFIELEEIKNEGSTDKGLNNLYNYCHDLFNHIM